MQLSACSFVNPITLLPSLIARRLVVHQTQVELFNWLGLELVLSIAWSFRVQLVVFFCSGAASHPRDPHVSKYIFLTNPHRCFIIGLIRNYSVFNVESLMFYETLRTT